MHRQLTWLAALMLAVALVIPASGQGKKPAADFGEPTCGDHGTSVKFEKDPSAAAAKARKEEKLVLVIHISGYFEEPDYT